MFRHRGRNRTYFHNLKLASAISFVAGIVNIAGVLSVKILTANITGHFDFFQKKYFLSIMVMHLFISFLSSVFLRVHFVQVLSLNFPPVIED